MEKQFTLFCGKSKGAYTLTYKARGDPNQFGDDFQARWFLQDIAGGRSLPFTNLADALGGFLLKAGYNSSREAPIDIGVRDSDGNIPVLYTGTFLNYRVAEHGGYDNSKNVTVTIGKPPLNEADFIALKDNSEILIEVQSSGGKSRKSRKIRKGRKGGRKGRKGRKSRKSRKN